MNHITDDILFGAMYYLSTFQKEEKKLYLTKKVYGENRKIFYNLCNLNAQSLKRHLDKLIKQGLVKEDNIMCGGVETPCYTFPYSYTDLHKYEIIENEMLWYIVSTRNNQAIRIYVYLLNKYKWKSAMDECYVFTGKELLELLGYSNTNAVAQKIITNILESFRREGIIDYVDYYEQHLLSNGTSVPTPRKKLIYVCQSVEELDRR